LSYINSVEKCKLYLQDADVFLANTIPWKFHSLQILFSSQIPFLAISFSCRFNFIFPCIFRFLQIPHFAKIGQFPSIFLSLQFPFLAKWGGPFLVMHLISLIDLFVHTAGGFDPQIFRRGIWVNAGSPMTYHVTATFVVIYRQNRF